MTTAAASYDPRYERRHAPEGDEGQRSPSERDRDSILYTTAFRRLAGVTQVISPAGDQVCHNRLTHTLEVAQIALRLAQYLGSEYPDEARRHGGIDPSVVEAAALAHDLGHPPFGHVAEKTLNELVLGRGIVDGYEGNAQSFRTITKLAVRRKVSQGLNLTQATLDAILKYPNLQESEGTDDRGRPKQKHDKWGAYASERADFDHARKPHPPGHAHQCLEAEIMDWADDIAYSIHDTEDFYRAGLVPLNGLALERDAADEFLDRVFERRATEEKSSRHGTEAELRDAFHVLRESMPMPRKPYHGTRDQRAEIRTFTSTVIGLYVRGTKLRGERGADGSLLERPMLYLRQVEILKELTWHYVINGPALAAQQYGQEQAIRKLFEVYTDATTSPKPARRARLPQRSRDELEGLRRDYGTIAEPDAIRVAADAIACMTDQQAMLLYHRLMGIVPGSSADAIVV